MRKFLDWFLRSSADSDKLSRTIKMLVPFLVLWGISDQETLEQFVLTATTVATGVGALWFLLVKIWNSVK